MEIVTNNADLYSLMENKVIGKFNLSNTKILFSGSNNILCCKGEINLNDTILRFEGSNSVIFIDDNDTLELNIRIDSSGVFYLGKNSCLTRTSHVYVTDNKNIIIGNDCNISFGNYLKTADKYPIYDISTKKRINEGKSILIGDYVWIKQSTTILENTIIGSGSILNYNSFVDNKTLTSNSIYGGNPIKRIKEGITYINPSNNLLEDNIKEIEEHIYTKDKTSINFKSLDKDILELKTSDEKLKYLILNISNNNNKNRFAINK